MRYRFPWNTEGPCYATRLVPTSTILPVTPPFPSNSCACLASARGNRCAMTGLIFCCCEKFKGLDPFVLGCLSLAVRTINRTGWTQRPCPLGGPL